MLAFSLGGMLLGLLLLWEGVAGPLHCHLAPAAWTQQISISSRDTSDGFQLGLLRGKCL